MEAPHSSPSEGISIPYQTMHNSKTGRTEVSTTAKMQIGGVQRDVAITRTFSRQEYSDASRDGTIDRLMQETTARMVALGEVYRLGEKTQDIVVENNALTRTNLKGNKKTESLQSTLYSKHQKLTDRLKILQQDQNHPDFMNIQKRLQAFNPLTFYLPKQPSAQEDQKTPPHYSAPPAESTGLDEAFVRQKARAERQEAEGQEREKESEAFAQRLHPRGDSRSEEVD